MDNKCLFKAKTIQTLYFNRDEAQWDFSKPYEPLGETYVMKRTGCILSMFYAREYLEDDTYTTEAIVGVFNDGMWILFTNIADAIDWGIEIMKCEHKD